MEEKEGRVKFELIIAYMVGYRPMQIVDKGYNKATAYRYSSYFKKAKEIYLKKFGGEKDGT